MIHMSLLTKQKQIQESLWLLVGKNREEGRVREPGMDMDTLLYLTWRASKDLLFSTGTSAQSSVITLWFPGGGTGEGIAGESGMNVDTLLYVTWRASKDLPYKTGNSAQCFLTF